LKKKLDGVWKKEKEISDAERKAKQRLEADEKLARELWENDKKREKSKSEKEEMEKIMNLVRTEAKTEMDSVIAKLMKEKEDLQAQLQNKSNFDYNKSVSLSLDDISYPGYWQYQHSDFQIFNVPKESDEFKRVRKAFTIGMPNSWVNKIERVQNKTLWTFYFLLRKLIGAKFGGNPNELSLYHGSRTDAYDVILRDGLDHRVANLAGAIGAGIYFGKTSGTSSGYIGHNASKKMLQCRVTLGSVGQGKNGIRRPPEKSHRVLHDSVGNDTMFVIFDNHQSYPEYVIHYN